MTTMRGTRGRSRGGTRRSAPRNATLWLDTSQVFTLTANTRTAVDLTAILLANFPSMTNLVVLRILGEISVRPAVPAATGQARMSVGIIVVTEEAFTAGVASMPNPAPADPSEDWMWAKHFAADMGGLEVAAGSFGARTTYLQIDNRSKRRMNEANKRLVLILGSNDAAAATHAVTVGFRVLFKLP